MIRSNPPDGPRDNLRLRLLLRFADGPMSTPMPPDGQAVATAAADVALRLQLLHAPRLLLADGAIHELERKDAALLAMLAVEGPTPRARASSVLWPDIDEERARNSLRQRLFRLRKLASRDVVRAGNVLALAEHVEHDLDALGPRLVADPDAVAGELLGELDYGDCAELSDWVRVAREQWRTARRNALAEIAARLEAEGRIAPALHYAQRLVNDDPTLEHGHRRVMRLHYLRGDRAAALTAFERCRELLGQHVGARPGKETLELARLIEASGALPQAAPPALQPVTILRPPRLIGREREWQLLERAREWQRAALVTGEPGMGKTRLLSDFAAANGNALVVGSRPGDERVPYVLLAALLRALVRRHGGPDDAWVVAEFARVVPELGEATGRFEPLRLQLAVTRTLEQWHEAGLRMLILDDLQFADEATLDMLPALATTTEARIVWLLGARSHQVPPRIADWLAQAERDAVLGVELEPLTPAAIGALLASLALPGLEPQAWVEPLARHTGGNPMFILETLRAMLAQGLPRIGTALKLPVPDNIDQLIERRLGELTPAALKLARVAALAGPDFSADLAAQVLGVHALDLTEPWRELEAAQVIRDNAFAHDLIFEATLNSVPKPIARLLHRDIATYLEAHEGAAARIAGHWEEALNSARAAMHFERAAEIARAASRRSEELALLERAQHGYELTDQRAARFECLQREFSCALHVGSMRQAEELIERMRPLVEADRQRALLLIDEARVGNTLVREQAALSAASEAGRIAERLADTSLLLAAGRERAGALSKLNRHDEALQELQALRPLLQKVTVAEEETFGFLADFAYLLCYADRPREAVEEYDRVHRLALAAGDLATAHTALTDKAIALFTLGELRASTDAYERARALRERLGDGRGWSLMDDMALAGNYRELGRYREALEMTHAALDALRKGGYDTWAYQSEHDLAVMYAQLGQPGRARKLLTELPPDAVPLMRVGRLATMAKIERWSGRPSRHLWDQARAVLDEANPGRVYVRLRIQLGQLRESDEADAAVRIASVRKEAHAREQFAIERCAFAFETEALLRTGEPQSAAERAHQLVADLRNCEPNVIYTPEAWLIAVRAFESVGADADAAESLHRGVAWIRDTALPNVPTEFVDSFMNRNPVNRTILTSARVHLG